MLEDLLTASLPSVSGAFGLGTGLVPPEAVSLSSLFSGGGAVILGKFTGSVGTLTMPINYSALFVGALAANWMFRGVHLPMDQQIQQPLLVTLGGMLIGAFSMMWWQQERASGR